ncbi:MAG: LysM peptidoglycan-binding domain-containing protein [Burkholderiales bacterium]|nr:LysM peptidoglycan-binding domain-containing protein [Anaerolineae bacterium]
MAQPFKICPICDTPAHRNATVCSVCGTSLDSVKAVTLLPNREKPNKQSYDHHYGETDLFEGDIRWRGGTYLFGAVMTIALLICGGLGVWLGARAFQSAVFGLPTAVPTAKNSPTINADSFTATAPAEADISLNTNTPFPTPLMITVTLMPSPTETPGPCTHVVAPNDDLISIVFSCGHRTMDIVPTVLAINGLEDAALIQSGQTLIIPWPTPTLDPSIATAESTAEAGDSASLSVAGNFIPGLPGENEEFVMPSLPTPTLPPGVAWHQVQPDENIISIAFQYGADIEILSQLNPEITFSQCNFGLPTGGENCIVQVYIGQQVRVPAPTPTSTLPPTASGSETATPTPTATFNAPSLTGPGNLALFRRHEFVTLRWVASGTLSSGQVYSVRVKDLTLRTNFSATTQDLFFIVPSEWQGEDTLRHEYEWTISVIDTERPDDPYFVTQPRIFTWEGSIIPTPEPTSDEDTEEGMDNA